MSNIDFNKLYPWRGIELVTIDEQKMVKIPKFYVKVGIAPAGTDQAGKNVGGFQTLREMGIMYILLS